MNTRIECHLSSNIFHFGVFFWVNWDCLDSLFQSRESRLMLWVYESQHDQCIPPLPFLILIYWIFRSYYFILSSHKSEIWRLYSGIQRMNIWAWIKVWLREWFIVVYWQGFGKLRRCGGIWKRGDSSLETRQL